jgi:hypothetical protein
VSARRFVIALVLVASSARADAPKAQPDTTPAAAEDEHAAASAFAATVDYEQRVRWQSELALFLGDAAIDRVSASTSPGYSLASGVHRDRLTLLGEYTLAQVHYRAPIMDVSPLGSPLYFDSTGLLHRLGLTARYSVVKLTSGEGITKWIGELWLEGGIGEQIARWDRGGTFTRPDIALGIGVQGARRGSARSRGGLFAALRVQFGHRTDIDNAPPTCSAPCTMPSPPAAWSDRAALLHVGFLFGD